jgi:uncharacterized protein YecT (DUF1311 family)
MKKIITTLFILTAFSSLSFCQTQTEMNQQASVEFKKADKELNKIYGQLLSTLDASEKKAFVASEKAWITFRDLECKFECMGSEGGSMYPMLYSSCMTSMTEKRTTELKEIIKERDDR